MKEIGAFRRVDELGRIVIPKSIRTKYKIRQGDVFEIFVDDSRIILQKEEVINELCNTLYSILNVMAHTFNIGIVVTDTDKCIYVSDKLKSYVNKEIPTDIIDMILNRKKFGDKLNKMSRSKSFMRLKGISKGKGILKPSKSYINLRSEEKKIQFGKARIKGYHLMKK